MSAVLYSSMGRLALLLLAAAALAPASAQAQIAFRGAASAGIASTGDILHVGAGAAATNDGGCPRSVSPARPAGNVGDLLIALAVAREDSATVATPAGWNLLYSATYTPVGQEFRAFIFYRIATSALATGDAITVTESGTCGSLVARVSRFRNVDATQPFLNVPIPAANVVMQNSNNVDTGTETTVDPNAMLLVASLANDDNAITQGAGWNVSFESAHNMNRDLALNLHYQLQTTAGPKSISNWAMGATDENIGIIFSLRPSGLRINVPAGTVANDVMIASIAWRDSPILITPPAGWTLVRETVQAGGGGATSRLATYFRVAGGTEPASYQWNFHNGGSVGAVGGIVSFSGVDVSVPANIVNAEDGAATGSSDTHTAAGVATTVAGTMLVGSFEFGSSTSNWAAPGGMTEAVDVASLAPPDDLGLSMEMTYQTLAAAGVTGPRAAVANTTGANADQGAAHLLALRPTIIVVPVGDFNAFETATAGGSITGRIYTKLAGTGFALDVVAILAGAQQNAFNDTVLVDLVTGSTGGLNCPGTPVAIAGTSQNVNLTSGRVTTGNFIVANAFRDVRVRVQHPVASPTLTSCSTDNFTIRPAAFSSVTAPVLTNASDTGAPVAKAGDSFQIDVVAGAGYDGTPVIDSTKITAHAGAIQTGSIGGTFAAANPATGTASGATFTYSEVGNFRFEVNGVFDNTFVDASSDQGNGDCTNDFSNVLVGSRYGCSFGNSAQSAVIGRFTPDHFDISLNAPVFTPACTGFTYVGQAFNYSTAPVVTVTARNAAGLGNAITRNYTGTWQKITTGTLTYPGGTSNGYRAFAGTLNVAGAPANPTVAAGGAGFEGTVTLTFGSGTGLLFTRAAAVAPFDADISLAINVIDGDLVAHASNPAKFGNEVAGGGMIFSDLNPATTNDKSVRFGRLRFVNASGSQLVPLPVPLETQYWGFTNPPVNSVLGFITNTADSCTRLDGVNIEMFTYQGALAPAPNCRTRLPSTPVTFDAIAFTGGRARATLSAPAGGVTGSVDLRVRLEQSPAGPPQTCISAGVPSNVQGENATYLQGNWTGAAFDQNPTARARFGIFKGADEVIFIRENFQ